MFVALVAIILTIVRSEGCGTRYTMIGSLDFSLAGTQLVVARYDARDANTPMKLYKADVSRTISTIDVETCRVTAIVQSRCFCIWG